MFSGNIIWCFAVSGIAAFFMCPATWIRVSSKYRDNCCSLLLFETTSLLPNYAYSLVNSCFWMSLHNIFSALNNSITARAPCLVSPFNFLALRLKQILSTQLMTFVIFGQLPYWMCIKLLSLTTLIATNVYAFLISGLVSSSV